MHNNIFSVYTQLAIVILRSVGESYQKPNHLDPDQVSHIGNNV